MDATQRGASGSKAGLRVSSLPTAALETSFTVAHVIATLWKDAYSETDRLARDHLVCRRLIIRAQSLPPELSPVDGRGV
jgi:hypothetical protein